MIVSDEVLARSLTLIARDLFSDLVIQFVEDNYYQLLSQLLDQVKIKSDHEVIIDVVLLLVSSDHNPYDSKI